MNIDLTSGTLFNVVILGVGVYLTLVFCFWRSGLSTLSHPVGYFAAVLLGFVLMPHVYIIDAPVYKSRTEAVVTEFGHLLTTDPSIAERIARPAYDLFLREIPNAELVIERVHALGEQKRLFYSLSRLFFLSSRLFYVAGIARLLLWPNRVAKDLAWFLPSNRTVAFPVLVALVGALAFGGADFNRRGNSILIRERNLEMMAILINKEVPSRWAETIRRNSDLVRRMFPERAEIVPNSAIQP